MKEDQQHIDSLLKDKLGLLSMPYEDKHWEKMATLLPKRKPFYKRPIFLIFFVFSFFSVMSMSVYFLSKSGESSTESALHSSKGKPPYTNNSPSKKQKSLETSIKSSINDIAESKALTQVEQNKTPKKILDHVHSDSKIVPNQHKVNSTSRSVSNINTIQQIELEAKPQESKNTSVKTISAITSLHQNKQQVQALTPVDINSINSEPNEQAIDKYTSVNKIHLDNVKSNPVTSEEKSYQRGLYLQQKEFKNKLNLNQNIELNPSIQVYRFNSSEQIKRKKFELNVSAGWLSISTYKKPEKSSYQFGYGWQGEALLGYQVGKNIGIHTGINISNTKQELSFRGVDIMSSLNREIQNNSFWNLTSETRVISEYYFFQGIPFVKKVNKQFFDSTYVEKIDTTYHTVLDTIKINEQLRHEQISATIPLLIGITKHWRYGTIDLLTGPSATFVLDNKMMLTNEDNGSSSLLITKSMSTFIWNYELRLRGTYVLRDNWILTFEPGMRTNLSNSFTSNSKLVQKSLHLVFKSGLLFKF